MVMVDEMEGMSIRRAVRESRPGVDRRVACVKGGKKCMLDLIPKGCYAVRIVLLR
jgi:hypothetical protein